MDHLIEMSGPRPWNWLKAMLTQGLGLGILSICHLSQSLEIVLGQPSRLNVQEEVTMQVLTKRYPKNCLLTVMDRYSAVVRNMEQVVMIPSLLRDVHLTGPGEQAQTPDLYTYFTMLKSIRVEVDHGLLPREEWQAKVAGHQGNEAEDDEAVETEEAGEERISREPDLEAQFHLHFSSLHHILTHLTQKAQEVTRKYQEMTGQIL